MISHNINYLISTLLISTSLGGCVWVAPASVSSSGDGANFISEQPSVSGDGRYVAFRSAATNLVSDDMNGYLDIFVRDMRAGTTTRVSLDSAGMEGNRESAYPEISADGRYVAFSSFASNLVEDDTNAVGGIGVGDVFVHDRESSITTRVSLDSAGNEANGSSNFPAISADGRYVAFFSQADNLVPVDTNGRPDIFVRDRTTGITTRVSVDSAGNQSNDLSTFPSISADGRFVAFQSVANNLVPGDTNGLIDAFVHDRSNGTTERVSVSSSNVQSNSGGSSPKLSANGRYVVFQSDSNNIVAGDTNFSRDVFIRDRDTGITERVSINSAGEEANSDSAAPSVSADGRYVAFGSTASNLTSGDTNLSADVFVHDRQTGITSRVSTDPLGNQSNEGSFLNAGQALSADGRYVVFSTLATNLWEKDFNNTQDIVLKSIPMVTVTGIVPDIVPVGATASVTITGMNFLAGAVPSISGNGLVISNIMVIDENTITANVAVDLEASSGARNVLVLLPGTGPSPFSGSVASCEDCFTVF